MTLACDCWLEGLRLFLGAFFIKKKKKRQHPGSIPLQLEMPHWHFKHVLVSLPLGSALHSLMIFVFSPAKRQNGPSSGHGEW